MSCPCEAAEVVNDLPCGSAHAMRNELYHTGSVGSYMHNLISGDITKQEEQLMRFQEEIGSNATETAVNAYQQRIGEG